MCSITAQAMTAESTLLDAEDDRFGGKVITFDSVLACASPEAFAAALSSSLAAWESQGKRGIWLSIPVSRTELMPAAIAAGFALHHTEPDRVVLNAWLSAEENLMPGYTTHTMGIGAVVINAERQILALQEATGPASKIGGANEFWKYPTGLVNAGEGAAEAAVREVFEETGVETEVVSLVAMREGHGATAGGGGASGTATNLFAVFLMRPRPGGSTRIVIDPREVAKCQWMDCDQYLKQSTARMPPGGVYYTLNELAIAAYDKQYSGSWSGRDLPLGAKLAPDMTNMVYFGKPPIGSAVAHSKL